MSEPLWEQWASLSRAQIRALVCCNVHRAPTFELLRALGVSLRPLLSLQLRGYLVRYAGGRFKTTAAGRRLLAHGQETARCEEIERALAQREKR